ncbi:hypothetical protein [Microbacterium sp. 13-71-7]|jgi:predicted phage tail protein|uniref:hypothetical protein n=1 Tax=Microbacterium sp. 13-71-7 TaxID=1970399 RepID=UPI000BCBA72D|nr:hypothetical protein [Microbacterium sp. 13-71-7]OZB85287.1 MAG: hypothetical protein B7X32_03950 [Microbacterium sp. 13-71-7]
MSSLKVKRSVPAALTAVAGWFTFVFGAARMGILHPLTGDDAALLNGALTVSAIFLAFCVVSLVLIRVLERRDRKGHKGE